MIKCSSCNSLIKIDMDGLTYNLEETNDGFIKVIYYIFCPICGNKIEV